MGGVFGADVASKELGCFHIHSYKDFVPAGLGILSANLAALTADSNYNHE
jgi:hypothetical protein